MRALVLTTSYPLSEESLSGRFIEELLHGLVPHGWSFHVVTPASPDGPRRFTSGPVTIEAVGYPGYRSGLVHDGGMPDRLALAPWLAAAVPGMTRAFAHAAARRARTEPLDLIWSHWLLPAGWIGAGLARATGLPHLVTAHGGDVHLVERLARVPGGRALLRGRFGRTQLSAPAAHTAARVQAALGLDPVRVAPLPAEVGAEGPGSRPAGGPLEVLFLGRFEAIKGAGLLLDAVGRLGRADVSVVMAGAGREASALRVAAGRLPCRVAFPGTLRGAARLHALRSADLLVVPSRRGRAGRMEGLPHAASLALANGTPVVAPEGGALAELVRAYGAGAVYEAGPDDRTASRALAGTLGRLAADPARRAALRRGALEAGAAFHARRAVPAWDRLLRASSWPPPGWRPAALALEPQ
jgi:glycosyltransferase involved in cell wall biosynthesis